MENLKIDILDIDENSISYKQTLIKMRIAAAIDDGLKAKGMKKKDLALKMNKNGSEVTKWLSGTQNFTIDTLIEIDAHLELGLFFKKEYCRPCDFKGTQAACV